MPFPAVADALVVHSIPFAGAADLPGKDEVGSKAHNLMVMARQGLPVPPGFVLGTDLCRGYLEMGPAALHGLREALEAAMERLGAAAGRKFDDAKRPLLVSVRSGAAVSMPGMMETVLNVGLGREAVQGLIRLTGNPRLAWDCRRRLIQQYAEVVHGASPKPFEEILAARLAAEGLAHPAELDSEALAEVAEAALAVFEELTGEDFPESGIAQLAAAVEAVLKSWSSDRARSYRRLNGIDDKAGTATTVQAMVFGNSGPASGSGVGFTRNPADGADALYVDYLPNAQGEDVVAGRRNALGAEELARRVPAAFAELAAHKATLERAFADMQDFEFTVEDGRLFMLQCRTGKRTPLAALRIARDLAAEGLISPATALERLAGIDLGAIEIRELVPEPGVAPLARAVPAAVGVVVGAAVMDPERIAMVKAAGRPVILLRTHAETADIKAVAEVEGLVTTLGARTSHAAVVARQLGKVCLVGCGALAIDPSGRSCRFGDAVVKEGDILSIDGTTGAIYGGAVAVRTARPSELIDEIRAWGAAVPAGG